GRAFAKAPNESAKKRTPGRPGTTADAASSAVYGVRSIGFDFLSCLSTASFACFCGFGLRVLRRMVRSRPGSFCLASARRGAGAGLRMGWNAREGASHESNHGNRQYEAFHGLLERHLSRSAPAPNPDHSANASVGAPP